MLLLYELTLIAACFPTFVEIHYSMKQGLTLIICLFCIQLSFSQIVDVPDVSFKTALLNHDPIIDVNGDGEIQVTEAQSFVAPMNIGNSDIQDITGIEAFINIAELNCNNNEIETIDLSANFQLVKLNITANYLFELVVNANANLVELSCNGNNLSALDLSANTALEILNAAGNGISTIDLSQNIALTDLKLDFNSFNTIDISSNVNLLNFAATYCYSLQNIDFTNNPLLEAISLRNSNLPGLDVTQNPNLKLLSVININLITLDLSNNLQLFNLIASDNSLVELDLSANTQLEYLLLRGTNTNVIDVSENTNLIWLSIGSNSLDAVNAKNGNNQNFTYFNISNSNNLGSVCIDDINYATANFTNVPSNSFFTEICSAEDCEPAPLNYTQGFEAIAPPNFDVCWLEIPTVDFNTFFVKSTTLSYTGDNGMSMRINSDNQEAYLISPILEGFGSDKRVSFYLNSYYAPRLTIGTISDPTDVSTFTPFRSIETSEINIYQWRKFSVDFTDYEGGDTRIAFKISEGSSRIFIDDFQYTTSPSCIEPIKPNAIGYATEALINWEDVSISQNWDIEYGAIGFTQGTGTVVNANTKPFLLQGLNTETEYDYYVRSRCSAVDFSEWSASGDFTTGCEAVMVDYTYGFDEGYNGEYMNCWRQIGNTYLADEGHTSTSLGSVVFRSTNEAVQITPELSNLNATKRIKFWLKKEEGESNLVIGTLQDPNDFSTFTPYETIESSILEEGQWEQIIINFDNYTGSDRFVVFSQESEDTSALLKIDEFVYQNTPSCSEPTEIEPTVITDTSISLEWLNSGGALNWEIQYGLTEFEFGSGTILNASSENTAINGLYPDTSYDIYIRSHCGGSDYSDWFKLYDVTTACGPFDGSYTQDFDVFEFANCWFRLPAVDLEENNPNAVIPTNQYRLGNEGYNIKFNNYEQVDGLYLVSPEFSDLNNGNKRIRFWLQSRFGNSSIVVGTMTNPSDESTFTAKQTIERTEMVYAQWKQFTINFDDYVGNDSYIAFKMEMSETPTNNSDVIHLDAFEYGNMPTCQQPINLENLSISNGELELTWTEQNNATQWEILYGEEGFWLGDGTLITASSNPFVLSGLAINTTYDFYVRAVCNAENTSDWSDKITVDFGCGQSYGLDYSHNFNTATLDDCWTAYEFPSNQSSTNFSISSINNFGDTGYSAYLRDSSQFSSSGVMMVSPLFTDLSNDKKIEFYISNYSGGLVVGTMSDPDNSSTFEELATITGSVTSDSWEKRIVYLADYNGTDQFIAFKQKKTSSSHGNQVLIDDFTYLQSVLCVVPTDLSLGAVYDNSVEVQWTGSGVEDEWEIEYEEIGVFNSAITLTANTNNYLLENLLEGTEYTIKVRAKCDDDSLYSDWTEEITFFTGCLPIEANYLESFEFQNELNRCWSSISSDDTARIYPTPSYGVSGSFDYEVLPVSGDQFLYFRNSSGDTDLYLVSRRLLDIDNTNRVRFHLISNASSGSSTYNTTAIEVGTMSDPTDISTFTLVGTVEPEDMSEFKTDGRPTVAWKEHTIYFDDYTDNDEYIAIRLENEVSRTNFFLDDFRFEVIPDCTEPLYPVVLDERYDAVDVSWSTYENSSPATWEIQYGPSDFEIGNGTTVTADSNIQTLQNLIDDTSYDFYVRANCGSTDSDWSVKQTFKTKCEGYEVVYIEGFENQPTGYLESCWTGLMPQVGSPYWDEIKQISVVDNDAYNLPDAHTGNQAIRFLNETNHPLGDGVSEQTILVTPRLIDLNNYKKVSFWMYPISSVYATPSEVIVGTMTDPDDYTTFTPYYTISDAWQNEDAWTKYEIDLSNLYLENEYIGIRQAGINERQLILFDDFEYKESDCVTPTTLQATQTGSNEITLTWQDNNTQQAPQSWEVAYGPVGFSEGGGTTVAANSNPFSIDGLNTFSDYEYRVRAYCNAGDGYSNWSIPYAFTITCIEEAPFYENFDQYDASYQYALNQPIPNFCWTRNDKQVSGINNTDNLVVSPSSSPNVGFVNFYDSDSSPLPGVMVSPYLSDFDSNKILKIWLRNETSGSTYNKSGVIIGLMSNPLDIDTFEPFIEIEAGQIPRFGKEFLVDFSSYTGNSHHIAIMHNQVNDLSLVLFDDLEYKDTPACLEPINVDFVSVSDTNVIISWENFGIGTSFEVEYGAQGFILGNGTVVQANDTTITIDGLNSETSYEFYVRTNCGASGISEWVGPINAETSCDIVSLPWIENFNTMSTYGSDILPECFQGDDVWVSSNTNLSAYQVGDGDTHYLYATYDDFDIEAYLITPMFSLEAGTTYTLSFKIRKEAGDYSSQGVKIWTGRGNTTEALDNYINYFGGFNFGFYNYYPIETTFTPVISGDYSFLFDFSFSAPVHTISIDSFSLNGDYDASIQVTTSSATTFDFNGTLPQSLILEETENTQVTLFNDNGEDVIMMSGGANAATWAETGNSNLNWIENQNNISKVNFEVDATAVSQLFMNLDLRQAFANIETESLFRVVVNGTILQTYVADNASSYQNIELDLSAFVGSSLKVSLQHLGRYRGTNSNIGDRAYIDNLSFNQQSTLGLEDNNFSEFSYYPNPVNDVLSLRNSSVIERASILDITGRRLKTYMLNQENATIDMTDLPSAMYFVEVRIGNAIKIIKVLKD